MQNATSKYLVLLASHIALAAIVFVFPFIAKIYLIFIFLYGFYYVVKNQNKNNEVLIVAGYIVGAEVFLRATDAALLYEFSKYGVILFIFIGMFYSGFSKNAVPYWLYLLLLIPSLIIATFVLNASTEDRKIISFTISGPVCLGIASLYTYQRKIHINSIYSILLAIGLPIISLTTYLILFNPSVRDVVTGTDSNFETSGGFGPNQVATVLGLGLFIFLSRVVLRSKNSLLLLVNFILAIIIAFRAIVTFSRGGVFTAIFMFVALLINLYFLSNTKSKIKLIYFIAFATLATFMVWGYSALETNGMIEKRYSNQDASGRVKESRLSGREVLIGEELKAFFENPILGVGVGKSMEIRKATTEVNAASHNEVSRLLAEHGSLGIVMLLILIFTPLFLYFDNKQNIFMFPFLLFWFLTINHAAMRIAAPAFIYALSLLKVHFISNNIASAEN